MALERFIGGFLGGGLFVMALAFTRGAAAETVVRTGGGSETWTRAGSPYAPVNRVEFENLTIEAGAVVRMPAGGVGDVVSVTGLLVVKGTERDPVVFEQPGGSVATASGGIRAATFDVTGAIFRYCYFGLAGGSPSTMSRVIASVFEGNNMAISTYGNVAIDRVAFVGNYTSVFGYSGPYDVTMSNSTVSGGNGLVYVSSSANVSVTSSTFVGSTCPLASAAPATLRNSIISGGQFVSQSVPVTITDSIVWQAAGTTYPTLGEGVLREDPLLVSSTDLRLDPTSPAIDSGSPTGAPDHDFLGAPRPYGAGFDMGAYEYAPSDDGGAGGEGGGDAGGAAGDAGAAGEGGASGSGSAGSGGASGAGALGGAGGTATGGTGTAGAAGVTSGGTAGTNDPTGGSGGTRRKGKKVETTGCGCRTPRPERAHGGLVALGAAAIVAWRVRRRTEGARRAQIPLSR